MNNLIKFIEKRKPVFEKISRNIYLGAIRDGFLAAMPVILFSSIFILIAAIPEVVGIVLPEAFSSWLWKVYGYSMGVLALLVSATTARALTESLNRNMPANKKINAVSVMLASMVGFLLLSADQIENGLSNGFMGTKGILAAFVSAFITANIYKVCVINDITIKMPKEVPGTISQTFRDVFPFSFAVFATVIIDTVVRMTVGISFAEAVVTLLQPLFTAADGYLGIAIIWGAMAFFWFVGVHGPSIVEPAIVAVIYSNVEANLQLAKAGEHASNVLTAGLGNFAGTMGGTGATLVVPFLFLMFAKSKQLKAVGKASFIPVSFAVNEPLLFATPMILNPYFFVPFLLTPIVNVCIFKFFVDVLKMNSFMYVLPWATPAPIGIILGTGAGFLSIVLTILLIVVDMIIYFPFFKAYDLSLVEQEKLNALDEEAIASTVDVVDVPSVNTNKELINVLVLCAGAGTSAMLSNALNQGAEETGAKITSTAGAYGSHYEILKNYDLVVLAPQVSSYYDDIKQDTDKLNIRLVGTKGAEYIKLTRDPIGAVKFVLSQFE